MKHFRIMLEGKSYLVSVDDPVANPVRVTVDGKAFDVELEAIEQESPKQTASPSAATLQAVPVAPRLEPSPPVSLAGASARVIKAPMPGTINKVSVAPGERVEYGQELCVLEAMKMKNVIRAPGPGVVDQVHASAGQSVQHGDVLMVFAE